MSEERSGADKVSTQHRLIDSQLARLAEALQEGALATAEPRVERLLRSLKAHFTLEEDFYFPRAEAANGERRTEIEALRAEHVELDRALEETARHIREGTLDAARQCFKAFHAAILEHERVEVSLLVES